MKIIVCVDDNYGISFNKRRVSKDRKIIDDINLNYNIVNIKKKSKDLFNEHNIVEDFTKGYNFVEDETFKNKEDTVDEVIIYYFNRRYPSDIKLELDLSKYKIIKEEEFAGFSHEKITKIVYGRNI